MTPEKMVVSALKWLNYKEKKSAASLDSKDANAGSGNYQRFQPICNAGNGDQWCQYYVGATAIEACGSMSEAQKLLRMPQDSYMTGYTPEAKSNYVNAGAWRVVPEVGDQAFFYIASKGRVGHTGWVIGKNPAAMTFLALEGNTSSDKYDDNGGCVAIHEYSYKAVGGTNRVNGFGIPAYTVDAPAYADELAALDPFAREVWVRALGVDYLHRLFSEAEMASNLKHNALDLLYKLRTSEEGRRDWITSCYYKFLDRKPREDEILVWLAAMEQGTTREDILRKIQKSQEAKERKD
jgi:hypothetical protein